MIASMAAVGLGSGLGGSSANPPPVIKDDVTPVPTPDTPTFPDGAVPIVDATEPYVAVITTDKGEIEVELATDAPDTVNSFAFLAAKNFYDGTIIFFRDEFFAQGGDPTCTAGGDTACTGLGGPGYTLALEKSEATHEQWALIAPAIAEGEIHGSQFRILFQEDPRLDGQETVFGRVVGGQEILEALPTLLPCSMVDDDNCDSNLSAALVIEDVEVHRK